MKLRNKTESEKIDGAVASAINYEVTVADLARKSVRRAWIVAFTSLVMSLILLGGYFYMLPLKEKVPYLVMADAYTGTATVAKLRENSAYQSVTAEEAVTRSNVAHFVLARESYDASLIGERDWRIVYTMSSKDVAAQYDTLHSRNNPQSPMNLYGTSRAIRIKILSIIPIGGGGGEVPRGATVRFQRTLFDKTSGVARPLDNKIATLEFKYNPNLKMDEEDRIENPLGFQVTDYRLDTDYASPPPTEISINTTPASIQPYNNMQIISAPSSAVVADQGLLPPSVAGTAIGGGVNNVTEQTTQPVEKTPEGANKQ